MKNKTNAVNIKALNDPQVATAYLKKSLDIFTRTGDAEIFLKALSHLTKCQGGMTALSRRCGINRQNLYRTFAETGNPKLKSLSTILKALGYNITLEPYKNEETDRDVEAAIKRITESVTENS